MLEEHFFEQRDTLFAALLELSETTLRQAIEARQSATLLLSGGGTPAPLYQALSEVDLEWGAVKAALVDERWVEPGHKASNESFAKQALCCNKAAAVEFIGMKNTAVNPEQGLAETTARYSEMARPFTLTILGMGPDGHTASLFPNAEGLAQALDTSSPDILSAIRATPSAVTGEYTERMTLSLKGILDSELIVLIITGEEKLAVYRDALASKDVSSAPVAAVLQQDAPIKVFWAP